MPFSWKAEVRAATRSPPDAREAVDQLLGHTLAEPVLVAGRTHVGEREDGDRRDRRRRVWRRSLHRAPLGRYAGRNKRVGRDRICTRHVEPRLLQPVDHMVDQFGLWIIPFDQEVLHELGLELGP